MTRPAQTRRIGYLMNAYPMTSTTFIRREIHAVEKLGHEVKRYAIRPWSEALVDQADLAEQAQTFYLLSGRKAQMFGDLFALLLSNPGGVFRALAALFVMLNNARTNVVHHVAYFLEAASLARRCKADGIEHLHAHFSTNTAAVAAMARRMGGPGFSFMVHGPDELVDPGPASLKFKVEEADFVAAISHYCKTRVALAAGYAHWDKIRIVRCGIDLDEFPLSDAPFTKDAPLVCVGRLCPQKAQPLIVEALADVVDTCPDIRVEFIGDGESRAEIERLIAAKGLSKHVVLHGWKTNKEVREILGGARCLLLPSFAEGLPVVIMEALALGRPVISTYIAGIPELVDDEVGWIIPAGSREAIADAMKDAYGASAKSLSAGGKAGRARVEAQHDIHKNAATLMGHIEAAIRDGKDI